MGVTTHYLAAGEAPTRAEIDATEGAVLLEFGTDWCGFCAAARPHIDALVAKHPGVRHIRVEDGPGRPLGRSYRVRLWPNLVFIKDGAVVRQLARPSPDQMREAFEAVSA